MNRQPISQSRRDQLLETAADWVVRIQDGELSTQTLDAWQQWLAASPDHRQAFDDVQGLWGRIGELPHLPAAPGRDAVRQDRYQGDQRVRTWLAKARRVESVRSKGLAVAASVLLAVGVGLGGWVWFGSGVETVESTYRTVTGQHQTVAFPDGSSMELGAASEVSVQYSSGERAIELLQGIAFFDVEKNPHRPFVVRAGGGSVTAVGTAFSVQRRAAEVLVVVSDGLVEVAKPNPDATEGVPDPQRQPELVQLPAGQRVAYSSGAGLELPTATDVAAATAWRDGQLVFQDETLLKAIDDVNRYSRIPIRLGDESLNDLRLTGYVVTSQVDGWLSGLEAVLPVVVSRYPNEIVLSHRRDTSSNE